MQFCRNQCQYGKVILQHSLRMSSVMVQHRNDCLNRGFSGYVMDLLVRWDLVLGRLSCGCLFLLLFTRATSGMFLDLNADTVKSLGCNSLSFVNSFRCSDYHWMNSRGLIVFKTRSYDSLPVWLVKLERVDPFWYGDGKAQNWDHNLSLMQPVKYRVPHYHFVSSEFGYVLHGHSKQGTVRCLQFGVRNCDSSLVMTFFWPRKRGTCKKHYHFVSSELGYVLYGHSNKGMVRCLQLLLRTCE